MFLKKSMNAADDGVNRWTQDAALRVSLVCWMRDHTRICADIFKKIDVDMLSDNEDIVREFNHSIVEAQALLKKLEVEGEHASSPSESSPPSHAAPQRNNGSVLPISGFRRFDEFVTVPNSTGAGAPAAHHGVNLTARIMNSQGTPLAKTNETAVVGGSREKLVPSRTYRKLTRS